MSILSVVKDVCLAVGVNPLTSLFAASIQPRTQEELLSLANEMAQRIAWDTRDWNVLLKLGVVMGVDGVQTAFALPGDYKRMSLTTQLRRSTSPTLPLMYIPATDDWMRRRMEDTTDARGEWTIFGGQIHIAPALAFGETVQFVYLEKDCVQTVPLPPAVPEPVPFPQSGEVFKNDDDVFRLPERLLKLGMIWQWKANKGSPYAEDMGTYTDALMMAMGADKPAAIYVDRAPISHAAQVALPWPVGWGQPAP